MDAFFIDVVFTCRMRFSRATPFCRRKYAHAREAAEVVAEGMGLTVVRSDIDADPYTFMPWHPVSVTKLSHGRGSAFPAAA